jgi:hypothetical protein
VTLRSTLSILVLVAALLTPAACLARDPQDSSDEGPSILAYGLRGFWTGAELGLAIGYLSTGSHYESREWRKLVLGAGIGAIAGLGSGIGLAIVDTSADRSHTGWFVLRDMGYGAMLGALGGAAVGALFLVDSGRPKDILTGAAIGVLLGAGAGLAFGLLEGANAPRRRAEADRSMQQRGVRITVAASLPSGARAPTVMPMLLGRF